MEITQRYFSNQCKNIIFNVVERIQNLTSKVSQRPRDLVFKALGQTNVTNCDQERREAFKIRAMVEKVHSD